jgi:hypothetical protein
MENATIAQAIIAGLFGLGGMLVGGFVVYHRVESLVTALKAEIARVEKEQKDEFNQVWAKFLTVQPVAVCLAEKKGCMIQFAVFKEGQEEIKGLFKDLRADLKAELKLLRDCITTATSGKC